METEGVRGGESEESEEGSQRRGIQRRQRRSRGKRVKMGRGMKLKRSQGRDREGPRWWIGRRRFDARKAVRKLPGAVEKVLERRSASSLAGAGEAGAASKKDSFLVKFHGYAYRDVQWVPEGLLFQESPRLLASFLAWEAEQKEEEKERAEGRGRRLQEALPQAREDWGRFLHIHRVIGTKVLRGSGKGKGSQAKERRQFLVKWNGQPYFGSTWEDEEELQRDSRDETAVLSFWEREKGPTCGRTWERRGVAWARPQEPRGQRGVHRRAHATVVPEGGSVVAVPQLQQQSELRPWRTRWAWARPFRCVPIPTTLHSPHFCRAQHVLPAVTPEARSHTQVHCLAPNSQ